MGNNTISDNCHTTYLLVRTVDCRAGINVDHIWILYIQFSTGHIHSIQCGWQYDGDNAVQYKYYWRKNCPAATSQYTIMEIL